MEEQFFARKEENRMAEEKRQLFLSLGITPEDLSQFLQDPKRFPPETWEFLQKKREELEKQIDAKIKEMTVPTERKETGTPKNHWLFMK